MRSNLSEFREWCAALGVEVQMAAGEAHWQIGIVETHIRLLKNQPSLMEDELPAASIDELVEHCVAAEVRRQTFDGYSPLQWKFGTQCAREVQERVVCPSANRRWPWRPFNRCTAPIASWPPSLLKVLLASRRFFIVRTSSDAAPCPLTFGCFGTLLLACFPQRLKQPTHTAPVPQDTLSD